MKEYKPKEIKYTPPPERIIANDVIGESINTRDRRIMGNYQMGYSGGITDFSSGACIIPPSATTDPTTTTAGSFYYNTTERCLKIYIDNRWKPIGTVAISSPSQSPSASVSPSASISPSVSPSTSPSVSISASLSPSESPSVSVSASESPSVSPSGGG
jgi:hypothetical protein